MSARGRDRATEVGFSGCSSAVAPQFVHTRITLRPRAAGVAASSARASDLAHVLQVAPARGCPREGRSPAATPRVPMGNRPLSARAVGVAGSMTFR